MFDACEPLSLLLLLSCDHHFMVWGLKEQARPPLYHQPGDLKLTMLGLTFPFCEAEAELGCCPAGPFQPRCYSPDTQIPFVWVTPQGPSRTGEAVKWECALGHIPECESSMCCFLAVCPGASVSPTLSLSFPICEMETRPLFSLAWGLLRVKGSKRHGKCFASCKKRYKRRQ